MSRLDVAFRPKMWKPCVTLCCCLLGPRAETRIEKREIIPPRLFTTNSLVTTLTQFTSVEERTYSQMMVKTYLSSATTLVLVHGLLKYPITWLSFCYFNWLASSLPWFERSCVHSVALPCAGPPLSSMFQIIVDSSPCKGVGASLTSMLSRLQCLMRKKWLISD
jgi:hypothetical protein